ncbi:MAG: AAA family ATPase [Muribaculaceae bacterium]|nr:AAA family ATPase [Muribaculaceae bacterium]
MAISQPIFRRKIYDNLLKWKQEEQGHSALLIEGARRVGKSTLAEEFGKNEYKSYILVDFSRASKRVMRLFDDISDLDTLLMQLQFEYNVSLAERESLVIFDEVQLCPKARQAIKHLVADRRFDYIETGSLISITKNTKHILIPSEEDYVKMNPMDFEEFLWASGDNVTAGLLRDVIERGAYNGIPHRTLMRKFRLYMLVGGMPQAVAEYLDTKDLIRVDKIKRGIINLYLADFIKIDSSGRIGRLFENIPAQLNRKVSRYMVHQVIGDTEEKKEDMLMSELAASMTANMCHHTADPANGLAMDFDKDYFKIYTADTGLFVTLAFWDKDIAENEIYRKLLSDKLSANLGYVYENIVAQMIVAERRKLFYYTFPSENRHLYEVDFLISQGSKIDPIEVKSSGYKAHKSLDMFCTKYSGKVKQPLIVTTKEYHKEGNVMFVPVYLFPFIIEK